jgi:uncharacterized membrane protein
MRNGAAFTFVALAMFSLFLVITLTPLATYLGLRARRRATLEANAAATEVSIWSAVPLCIAIGVFMLQFFAWSQYRA